MSSESISLSQTKETRLRYIQFTMSSHSQITIKIRMSTAATFTIGTDTAVTPFSTVGQVKDIIASHPDSGDCSADRQRLIHKGRILNDDSKSLKDYGIVDSEQTIHLVKGAARPVNDQSAQAAVSTSRTSATPSASSSTTPSTRFNNGNPLNFMMGGGGLGNTQMPDMSMIQEQLMNNPELLEQMTNNPLFQSMMNNPNFIRSAMDSNPQMRQLLESNPELRQLLDDPEMMRRSMEMMRNPAAMQNMMRNQDLAMSQIENIPGGFSALRRMYEDVQEPLMDALSNNNTGTANSSSRTSSAQHNENAASGAAGAAMPNPWGRSTNASTPSTNANIQNSLGGAPNLFGGGMNNPWATSSQQNTSSMPGMDFNNMGMNIEQSIQMLENPLVQQMMDQMMQNPAVLQQMMDGNPMMRQLRETNPQMAQMMSNPETIRTMMNPSNLRNMLSLQNSMQHLAENVPGFTGSIGGTVPAATTGGGLDFSSILNQLQSTNIGISSPSHQPIPPEQRYRIQLQSLNDMGFDDNVSNIAALVRTHGNVNQSIDLLLSSPPVNASVESSSNHSDARSNADSANEKDKDV